MATPKRAYASSTSQLRRTAPTVLLRMAMDAERQQEIAARIRELRGPKPQRVIAEAVGVTLRAYQAWEAGGGINWENVGPLAEALGVSDEYLIFGRDKPDPSRLERIELQMTDALSRLAQPGELQDRLAQIEEQIRLLRAELAASDAEALKRSEDILRAIRRSQP